MQNGQTLKHPKCKCDAPTKGGMVEGAHPLLGVSLTLTLACHLSFGGVSRPHGGGERSLCLPFLCLFQTYACQACSAVQSLRGAIRDSSGQYNQVNSSLSFLFLQHIRHR